jgi:centromeric protein E
VSALKSHIAKLQSDVEHRESSLQQLMLQFNELQQRHINLEQECYAVKQEQAYPAYTRETVNAPACLVSPPDAVTCEECRCLRLKFAELLQRQVDLEAEMSDVQAACNVAIAEKHTLERAMAHRQAGICLGLPTVLARVRHT